MALADREATIASSADVNGAHLLIGLITERSQAGGPSFQSLDRPIDAIREIAPTVYQQPKERPHGRFLGPSAVEAFQAAERMAGNGPVEPEHIALGLVDSTLNALLFDRLEIDRQAVADEMFEALGPTPEPKPERQPTPPPPSLEPLPTHDDRPATLDALGRERFADVLAERLRRVLGENTEAPVSTWRERRAKARSDREAARKAGSFMIHVHAAWGAGKSSLLNFLADRLRNRDESGSRAARACGPRRRADRTQSQWIVVEFNAWQHQRLAPPWWWLLSAFRRAARRELWHTSRPRAVAFWLHDFAWRLWNVRVGIVTLVLAATVVTTGALTNWFGLEHSSLDAMKGTALAISAIIALFVTVWGLLRGASRWIAAGSAPVAVKFMKRVYDPLAVYQRRFRLLVRAAKQPVAFFIDDLDRCKPDYVVELLEGIQTLFISEPVIYVVAADRSWLCESYMQAYDKFQTAVGEPGRPLGYMFLEKTFQISLEIPPMSAKERRDFWGGLTRRRAEGGAAPADSGTGPTAEDIAGAESPEDVESLVADALTSSQEVDEEVLMAAVRRLNAPALQEQLQDVLAQFTPLLENNPRAMKRLVNAYGIERDRLIREGLLLDESARKRLVRWTILRLRWPMMAERLLTRPGDAARLVGSGPALDVEQDALNALFQDDDVRRVFSDEKIGGGLDTATLKSFAGIDEPTPIAGA